VVVERVKARKKSPPTSSSILPLSQSLSLATDRSPSPSSSAASVRPPTVVEGIESVSDAAMKALNKSNLDFLLSPTQPPTCSSILTSPQQLLTTEESSSSVTLATERLKNLKNK
jgi:hypothetical protein